jgi:tRNA dimethylallyltransferase
MMPHERSSAGTRPPHAGYYLVGPTAAGKTAVAQHAAEALGCEIVSADSMLVYSGMDAGTAKPPPESRRRVRHHGLDLTTPDREFSLGSYLACVGMSLSDSAPTPGAAGTSAAAAGAAPRTVLVVGGTGLYVKALLCGLPALPPPRPSVRAYWTDMLDDVGVEALQEALRRKSPGLFEALRDKQNPRRLIRALEMAEAGVEKPIRTWPGKPEGPPLAGLRMPTEQLAARIERRVEVMFEGGLVQEVEGLMRTYPALSATARQAIGYAEAMDLIEGRCSRDEAIARTVARTRQLAKRQRTWFAHQVNVAWLDIEEGMDAARIAERVLQHWREHGPAPVAV